GTADRRCSSCGALVGPDAEWCGQCFTAVSTATPVPVTVPATAGDEDAGLVRSGQGEHAAKGAPTWPCPVCDLQNAIESDVCVACGTPFAALFRDAAGPAVDPGTAVRRSLMFPGLGHAAVGRGGDGIARASMFVMLLGLALVVGLS